MRRIADARSALRNGEKLAAKGAAVLAARRLRGAGLISLEANPSGGAWLVPNEIQLEIPAPRHPQFIDVVEGQRLDWRPATPTLICVVSAISQAGVYEEHPSPGADMSAAAVLFHPNPAWTVGQQVYVLDRDGVESIPLVSAPPATTTAPNDVMSGQERDLRWSLWLRLRKRSDGRR